MSEQTLEPQKLELQKSEQQKFSNSKEVIAYLAQKFPLCFSLEGEAKPLKIGIFQDLAAALENDEKVSKTQLRHALRQYTSNWRYLHGCKAGAVRVDLDGNACGSLEQEHANHAAEQLQQAKAKVAERKAQMRAALKAKNVELAKAEKAAGKAPQHKKPTSKAKPFAKSAVKAQSAVKAGTKNRPAAQPLVSVDVATLQNGQEVKVKLAEKANRATILDVMKDSARVQLQSGMMLNVAFEHLYNAE